MYGLIVLFKIKTSFKKKLIKLLNKLKHVSKSIKCMKYALKLKETEYNLKTSFVKAWNIFVSYSSILVTVQNKYANTTSPLS